LNQQKCLTLRCGCAGSGWISRGDTTHSTPWVGFFLHTLTCAGSDPAFFNSLLQWGQVLFVESPCLRLMCSFNRPRFGNVREQDEHLNPEDSTDSTSSGFPWPSI